MAALYANEPEAAEKRRAMNGTKSLTGVKIKDAEKGEVEAVFSTFHVKDSDGDVTLPDAFEDGQPVALGAYGHGSYLYGAPPVGKGVIRNGDTEAVLAGQFFLNTQAGREMFETVKELGPLQEWSFSYDILESEDGEVDGEKVQVLKKLKVHEVSPVLLGAGVNTRTLAVKKEAPALSAELERVLGDVAKVTARVKAFGSQSAKEGRVLSTANRDRLASLGTSLGEAAEAIAELLRETDPNKHRDLLMRELMRFERSRLI
jgi:hypothetical protein